MREYKKHDKCFCGLSVKKLANQSEPLDRKIRSLANSVDLLLHGEHIVKYDT